MPPDARLVANETYLVQHMNSSLLLSNLEKEGVITPSQFAEISAVSNNGSERAANEALVRTLMTKDPESIDVFIETLAYRQPAVAVEVIRRGTGEKSWRECQKEPARDPWEAVVTPYINRLVTDLHPDKFVNRLSEVGVLTMEDLRSCLHRRQDEPSVTMTWLLVEVLPRKAAGALAKFTDVLHKSDDPGVSEWGAILQKQHDEFLCR